MKITASKFMQWSVIIAIFYFYFYQHIVAAIGGKFCYPFLFLCILFSVMVLILRKTNFVSYLEFAWILVLLISTVTNHALRRKDWLWPATFFMLIVLLLALTTSTTWHRMATKCFLYGSLAFCVATIIMFVLPIPYTGLVQFWGYYPNGTERGLYGYRAGIADNHSANGTYCVVAFLISVSLFFLEKNKKQKKLYLLFTAISLFAVLLTTKRAHLLFGVFSAIVCYYFSKQQGKIGRGFKVLCVAVVGTLLFYYASSFVPVLSDFMEGFERQSDISNGRYEFWKIALSYFKTSPIFGIGWLGFRYWTRNFLVQGNGYVDVHNVYIQILAESGIVGALIMLVIFVGTLVQTIQMLSKAQYNKEPAVRATLCVSLSVQVFCLVYGVTGNFLYDRTCFIYVFACALCYSIRKSLNRIS